MLTIEATDGLGNMTSLGDAEYFRILTRETTEQDMLARSVVYVGAGDPFSNIMFFDDLMRRPLHFEASDVSLDATSLRNLHYLLGEKIFERLKGVEDQEWDTALKSHPWNSFRDACEMAINHHAHEHITLIFPVNMNGRISIGESDHWVVLAPSYARSEFMTANDALESLISMTSKDDALRYISQTFVANGVGVDNLIDAVRERHETCNFGRPDKLVLAADRRSFVLDDDILQPE